MMLKFYQMALETRSEEVLIGDKLIKRVNFDKPNAATHAVLLMLQRQFYPEENLSTLLNKYRDLTKKRGAEVYLLGSKEKPIGVLDLRFYRFNVIAPQLYLAENTDEKGKTSHLSLKHFGQIINKEEKPEFVGELAYYAVAEQERGKKLGSLLFQQGIDRIKELIDGKGLLKKSSEISFTSRKRVKWIR